jgi:diketogulonate reductase-like aldo/keto reductase
MNILARRRRMSETADERTSRSRGFTRRQALGALSASGAAVLLPGLGRGEGPETLISRAIPKSGEKIPALGMGTWQTFDVAGDATGLAAAKEVLGLFVEGGGRIVDSSPMYGSAESVVGQLAAELGVQGRLFYATKVWTSGRAAGVRQMEASLNRMGVARMDLMQVHNLVDVRTHLATLREWKQAGRVRYIGITHYHAGAHGELESLLRGEELDFLQVNYSLVEPEAEKRLLPLAAERGVAVIANRPFVKGRMFERASGKPLPPWAAELGIASWAQFFLKWILGHPAVTCAIPATSKPKHLLDNLQAGLPPMPDDSARRRMAEAFRVL